MTQAPSPNLPTHQHAPHIHRKARLALPTQGTTTRPSRPASPHAGGIQTCTSNWTPGHREGVGVRGRGDRRWDSRRMLLFFFSSRNGSWVFRGFASYLDGTGALAVGVSSREGSSSLVPGLVNLRSVQQISRVNLNLYCGILASMHGANLGECHVGTMVCSRQQQCGELLTCSGVDQLDRPITPQRLRRRNFPLSATATLIRGSRSAGPFMPKSLGLNRTSTPAVCISRTDQGYRYVQPAPRAFRH